MTNDVASELVVSSPEREQAMRAVAREQLRVWMRAEGSNALEKIGRDAIRNAAYATVRTSRAVELTSAERILTDIEVFATGLINPRKERRRWWSLRHQSGGLPTESDLAALVERLDRQRDVLMRRMINLDTDRNRFAILDAALKDTIHLIRAFDPIIEAATRELRVQDEDEATRIKTKASAALLERQHAVLTQIAVHRQAIMTLDLVISNETILNAALEQARNATLSALQVAMAARRAAANGTLIAQQSTALVHTIEQANGELADRRGHTQRMLSDALRQARAAIAAMADRGTG